MEEHLRRGAEGLKRDHCAEVWPRTPRFSRAAALRTLVHVSATAIAIETSSSRVRPLVAAAVAVTFGLTALGWLFLALSTNTAVPSAWGFRGFPGIFAIAFGWIGYLVATRQPRNPIGWSFLIAGVLSGIQVAALEYASFALFGTGAGLAGGEIGAWINEWIWLSLIGFATVPVFLYFPGGHLLSERWRPVLWLAFAGVLVGTIFLALAPGAMQTFGVRNPMGIDSPLTARGFGSVGGRTTSFGAVSGLFVFGLAALFAAASSLIRFRRSTGETRQQLKWFASAAVVVAVALSVSFLNETKIAQTVLIIALTTVPIAIGVAILRYRLYEIDTLINRAIVYGTLTAVLAGLYSASIGLFQKLFVALTGQTSDAAIVITTLILASAFTPVKSWLQSAADRRFKSPGDAHKQLDSFRESLRLVSEAVDGAALRRRFVDEITNALRAGGARLVIGRGGQLREERSGDWTGATASCDLVDEGVAIGRIELCHRRDGTPYTKADLAELEKTAAVMARAYVIAERLALARSPGG